MILLSHLQGSFANGPYYGECISSMLPNFIIIIILFSKRFKNITCSNELLYNFIFTTMLRFCLKKVISVPGEHFLSCLTLILAALKRGHRRAASSSYQLLFPRRGGEGMDIYV